MPREPAATSARHARPPFRRAATSTTPTGIMPIGPVWLNTAKRSDLVGAMNRAAISGSWLREKCAFRRRRTAASAGRLAPADAQFDRRGSVTWRRTMKMLIAALTLATLISGPAFTQPTQRWPRRQSVGTKLQWLLPRVPSGGVVQD